MPIKESVYAFMKDFIRDCVNDESIMEPVRRNGRATLRETVNDESVMIPLSKSLGTIAQDSGRAILKETVNDESVMIPLVKSLATIAQDSGRAILRETVNDESVMIPLVKSLATIADDDKVNENATDAVYMARFADEISGKVVLYGLVFTVAVGIGGFMVYQIFNQPQHPEKHEQPEEQQP